MTGVVLNGLWALLVLGLICTLGGFFLCLAREAIQNIKDNFFFTPKD